MENIDITKLDIKELKALAYDFLVQSQNLNNNLKAIDVQLTELQTEVKTVENKDEE